MRRGVLRRGREDAMSLRAAPLLAAVALVAAGCATPPAERASSAPAAPCAFVRVEQGGKAVAPAGGTVTLARAPFTLAYQGPGSKPGLHAASKPDLASWLARQGRSEVWLSLGEGMAFEPGDLIVDDKVETFRDEGARKAAAQLVDARYWPMVRAKVEAASLDVAARAPLNVGWEQAAGRSVYPVRSINGVPVARARVGAVHLVAFGEVERVVAERIQIPLLARARWNGCTIRFQP